MLNRKDNKSADGAGRRGRPRGRPASAKTNRQYRRFVISHKAQSHNKLRATEPANGTVNFRVINASPSGPNGGGAPVDVWIVPAPLTGQLAEPATIPNVAYRSTSNYVPVPYNSGGGGFLVFVTVSGTTAPTYITGQAINLVGGLTMQ